jgi:hypothetical protein
MTTEQITEETQEQPSVLRTIFIEECPEEHMSDEFRNVARRLWPESEAHMPSPETVISIIKWVFLEWGAGKDHMAPEVFGVLQAISNAAYQNAEMDYDAIMKLHLDHGFEFSEEEGFTLKKENGAQSEEVQSDPQ